MSHLSGSVVFIDDEVEREGTPAEQLCRAIRDSGRPVFAATNIPSADFFEHWQSLAFVVLDWDLSPGSNAAVGGTELAKFTRLKMFSFVADLMKVIYCPIFIISSADTSKIKEELAENEGLLDSSGHLDRRIDVFPKDALMDDIVSRLEERVKASPALSVLTVWEKQFDRARNRLLIDLEQLEPDWPLYVWKTARDDGVDPDYELSLILTSNLQSRLTSGAFDGIPIEEFEGGSVTRSAMRRVSYGRTTIRGDRLSTSMVLPGDIFRMEDESVWINVSPACQTISRPLKPGEEPRKIRLHLLKGTVIARPTSSSAFQKLESKAKGPNGEVVHTLLDDESPYYFDFGHSEIQFWSDIRELRVARLLPPYVTRLQQKHAAYIQSEGLPRVTAEFYIDDASDKVD